ncbi:MAG: hypothetical protein EBT13_12565 [Rhodobacteraceae bacterium]|nr:hypothetical protein [Paracoccaceae bacterium]
MITATKIADATNRHQRALRAAFPHKITLATKIYAAAAVIELGNMEDGRGGFRQGKVLQATVLCDDIAESVLFDSTTGIVKRQSLTMDGTSYRVQSVSRDPQGVVWTLEATEAVM